MTRVMLMTFFGSKRWRPDVTPHESPRVMTTPLIVLGSLAAVGGILIFGDWIVHWLEPVTGPEVEHELFVPPLVLSAIVLAIVAVGAGIAWRTYGAGRTIPEVAPVNVGFATRAARLDLYGDRFNEEVFMRPGQRLTTALVYVDDKIIDGIVNGLAALVGGTSGGARRVQTGFVRSYALTMLAGALLAIVATLAVTLS